MDSKLLQIREELDKLTILEVSALVKELENHWGVSAAAPVAVAAVASAEDASEEQTEFKVVLKETGAKKIDVIKELRTLTSLGLAEAKAASETAGFVIKEEISKEDAEKIASKFKELGASVSVE